MPLTRSLRAPALLGAVLAVSLVGSVAAGPSSAPPQGQVSCDGRQADGAVTVVRPPAFPAPPPGLAADRRGRLVDLAVDRTTGQVLWVTDGWSIAHSGDAGCSWKIVHSLGAAGALDAQTSAIVALAVPDAADTDILYVLVQDLSVPNTTARFSLLVTDDGARNFVARGSGIAPVNLGADDGPCGDDASCDLFGTSDSATVYLRFASPDRTVIYRSTNQGQSFEARNAATEFGSVSPANGPPPTPPVLRDLVADPFDSYRLWGVSAIDGPHQSQDGGGGFTHYEPFEHFELPLTDIRHVDMVRYDALTASLPVVLVAGKDASGNERLAYSASEYGESFLPFGKSDAIRGHVTGMALTDRLGAVVGTEQGLFVTYLDGVQRQFAGPGHANLRSLQAVHAFGATVLPSGAIVEPVWGLNDTELVVLGVEAPSRPDLRLPDVGDIGASLFDPLSLPEIMPGVLRGLDVVNLAIGQTVELPYVLDVPPVPTQVDVFFLLDETGSMQDEFDALTLGIERIATDLEDAGIDVNVGLGTYGNGFRYKRYRAIGPVDREFRDILAGVKTGGDGEVAYTGLHQVLTGKGLKRSRAGNGVKQGQDAAWRPNSIRYIVHATDEQLSEEPEGPYIEEVLDLLERSGVRHLGLIANEVAPNGLVTAYDWEPMKELAVVTRALAPPGGVDCDSNGIADIPEGGPIACFLSPLTTNQQVNALDRADLIPDLASVIVAMLKAETMRATVQFNHSSSRLLTGFVAAARNWADFRSPVLMPARARAACTEANEGLEESVTLTGSSGTRVLGGLKVRVTCGLADVEIVTPPVLATTLGLAAASSPAAPPAPIQAPSVSQGAAQSGVQSLASSNSFVPQAGAAAAKQEQQQHQTAAIGKTRGQDDPGVAWEFAARRDQDGSSLTLAAAGVMALAAGLVRVRQRRGVPIRVRWRA